MISGFRPPELGESESVFLKACGVAIRYGSITTLLYLRPPRQVDRPTARGTRRGLGGGTYQVAGVVRAQAP